MVTLNDLPSPSTVYSAYASISASVMLLQTTFHQVVPRPLQDFLLTHLNRLLNLHRNSSLFTLVVEPFDGMTRNDVFDSFETYMSTKTIANPKTNRLKITKSPKEKTITMKFAQSETVLDVFQGIEIKWSFVCDESQKITGNSNLRNGAGVGRDEFGNQLWPLKEKHHFELQFEKMHKETVKNSYLPFVLDRAKAIRAEKKVVKLHTLGNAVYYGEAPAWDSVVFEHPSTFDKLAMELDQKKALMDDLDLFIQRKEYYKKVGRAWKRGYLLHGPPGTGKSSLIAAIANYLKFDIYDLQLKNVKQDSGLRRLLLGTANRSILVIEDIDCSVELPDRNPKMVPSSEQRPRDSQFTLAGLLNFIDGLWSSCGDERIIIFTTNNKDKLDPALLRPGRMDMHIHMSYLTIDGFKLLASNYLDIKDPHWRYGEIEELIGDMKVSPAEIAEELTRNGDADVCLGGLVNFLKRKKLEINETKDGGTTDNGGIELPQAKRLKTNGWK